MSSIWLMESLASLADYVAERLPEGSLHASLEVAFLGSGAVQLSGTNSNEVGETAGLPLDYDVVAITDRVKAALGQVASKQVTGLHLSLRSDGELSVEFVYAHNE